jgi:hypothetical protein
MTDPDEKLEEEHEKGLQDLRGRDELIARWKGLFKDNDDHLRQEVWQALKVDDQDRQNLDITLQWKRVDLGGDLEVKVPFTVIPKDPVPTKGGTSQQFPGGIIEAEMERDEYNTYHLRRLEVRIRRPAGTAKIDR